MLKSRGHITSYRIPARLAPWPAAILILATSLVAESQPASPEKPTAETQGGFTRRVRGLIHHDQTWSGRILIVDDTQISGAVVEVEPGTEILFGGTEPGRNPILTVGSADEKSGEIRLAHDEMRPISFGVADHAQPGAIVVYLHPAPNDAKAAGRQLRWKGVRFSGVGFTRAGQPSDTTDTSPHVPALTMHCAESGTAIELQDCRFADAGGVLILAGADSQIKIAGCELATTDAMSLSIRRTARPDFAGKVEIRGNEFNSGLMLDGVYGEIAGNTIAGDSASLLVTNRIGNGSQIDDNLLFRRCAARPGTYALSVNSTASTVTNNIIIGAETCVLTGPRDMAGNIIMAEPRAAHAIDLPRSRFLVASLPQGARFEQNYLIGPAGAMLAPWPSRSPGADPGPEPRRTIIQNNVFDGVNDSTWAIEFDAAGRPVPIAIENNLFVRLENIAINKTGGTIDGFTAGFNAFSPPPRRIYDRFDSIEVGPGRSDRILNSMSNLGIAISAETDDQEWKAQRLARQAELLQNKDRAGLRKHITELYRPRKNSPLIGAGKPTTGRSNIGPGRP